jgi:hypothetical protein
MLSSVRRFTGNEFDGGDPERPEIGFRSVSTLQDDFRCLFPRDSVSLGGETPTKVHTGIDTYHEQRSPYKRILHTLCTPQLTRNPEIRQLDLSRVRKDDVGGFNVSMDDPLAVEVFETVQDFSQNDGCLRFVQWSRFDLGIEDGRFRVSFS